MVGGGANEVLFLLRRGDGLVDLALGDHGAEEVLQSFLFASRAAEEIATAANFTFAEFLTAPSTGAKVLETFFERGEGGASPDEGFFGLRATLVLSLRCGGLIPFCEMEACVVQLGFQ